MINEAKVAFIKFFKMQGSHKDNFNCRKNPFKPEKIRTNNKRALENSLDKSHQFDGNVAIEAL